jgi:hypothetical protein
MRPRWIALCISVGLWQASSVWPQTGVDLASGHKDIQLCLLYPAEKLLKYDPLNPKAAGSDIQISGAGGESESFILVLRPRARRPLMDVRFECGSLKGPGGATLEPNVITCSRLAYQYVDRPSGTTVFEDNRNRFKDTAKPFSGMEQPGYYPEVLMPRRTRQWDVADCGSNTQFWFTVSVPASAEPGDYRGTIQLKTRSTEALSIRLRVHVFGFALPAASALKNTACWSPEALPSVPDKETLKAIYRDFALARQVPDPIIPPPVIAVGADGSVSIDTREYDEMLTYCLDELKMPHFFFPRGGAALYPNVYFLWQSANLPRQSWYGLTMFTGQFQIKPEFRTAFSAYLGKMAAHLRERGWLDKAYLTTMDEPHAANDFAAIRAYAAMVKEAVPELRCFCTTFPRPELIGSIRVWCPQEFNENLVRERQAAGEELMFYKNWMMLIDAPMANPRLLGWIAWRMKAVGWLTYGTMGKWEKAWEEPFILYENHGLKAWGLGLLFYPDLMRPGLLKSVRWEMMREGAEDWEYLRLLDTHMTRLANKPEAASLVHRAREVLQDAMNEIILSPHVLPGPVKDEWERKPAYTSSHQVVVERRNQIASLVEELMKTQ